MAILGGEVKPIFPVDLGLKECYYMEDHHKPILLQEFGSHGWTTMHVEDFQLYANFAREGKMAYRHSPAHHDYRAAFWALTKEKALGLGGGGLRNRLVGKANNYACQQELLAHTHQFRILEDFITGQPGPVFAFFHLNEYTHNVPAMAKHYDPSLYKLLYSLVNKGSLNNTFFFLLADHGFMRADNPFTMTEQGKIENNMPALMLLP